MATFESLFPTFLAKCGELYNLLLVVAYMLFIVGVIVAAPHHTKPNATIRLILRLLVLTALLAFLPDWGNTAQQLLKDSILNGLGVDPGNVADQYNALLKVKRDSSGLTDWWSFITTAQASLIDLIVTAILWVIGAFASFLLWWAYIFQQVILHLGYALSPILIGFMALHPLKHIGHRYLLNLVGVLLWPLGWGVAALVTQAVLDFMTDPSFLFIDPTATVYSFQKNMGVAILAFWVVFSTIAAPAIIQKVLAHGLLVGGPLISGAINSFLSTAATTAGAASVAAPLGKPLVTAAAAGLAATLSSLSTSANIGSAGAIIVAGSGLPPRGARGRPGDDITGDRLVRELIARSRNQYARAAP
jgi:hypothetical protein